MKKIGTSCFFVEPEIYKFLDWVTELATSLGIELLPEVHAHYTTQFKLAKHGNWIYDFILPYMILETLINKSSNRLYSYLKVRPHKQFTMLDCHDGIPVKPDLDDLVETKAAQKIVDVCVERGSNLSLIYSDAHKNKDGFDVHQIRCSYYSVLNCDDDAYLAARAIQFFAPGIPQVYYVGLLAGKNDDKMVKLTGEGREINRHNFTISEIEKEVQKPVVQRLLKLIDFRNDYPAFNGEFIIENAKDNEIKLTWKKEDKYCTLNIDLDTYGIEMLKAGTDLDDFSEEELINLDAKKFEENGVKCVIAQVNTVSIEDVLKRKEKLEEAINNEIEKDNLNLFVFAITDILNSNSQIIALGNRTDIIEKSYKLEDNMAFLEGVVSRKKQILPMVEKNI